MREGEKERKKIERALGAVGRQEGFSFAVGNGIGWMDGWMDGWVVLYLYLVLFKVCFSLVFFLVSFRFESSLVML